MSMNTPVNAYVRNIAEHLIDEMLQDGVDIGILTVSITNHVVKQGTVDDLTVTTYSCELLERADGSWEAQGIERS